MDATIRKDKRIAAGTQRRLRILIRNKKDINLVPAQACQMQPHTQQPARQGWQGTSVATGLPPLPGQLCSSPAALGSHLPRAAAPGPSHSLTKKSLGRKDVENRAGDEPLWSPSWLWCGWCHSLTQLGSPSSSPAFLHCLSPSLSCHASQLVPCYLVLCGPGAQNVQDYFTQPWQQ